MKAGIWLLVTAMFLAADAGSRSQDAVVRLGMARSTSSSAELMAISQGYFRDAGITVEIEDIDSSANVIALLAQGRLNLVAGGVSAGYFNALARDLPVTIVADRASTPIRHALMIRPDLKAHITGIRQLQGRRVAVNATGSIAAYEIGKLLQAVGLTVADVELTVIPFAQMAVAFANRAIDAAVVIPPFVWAFQDEHIAVPLGDIDELLRPSPVTIAVVMVNTDWARQHTSTLNRYFVAWLRGARDYCQGYHGGPMRERIVDVLVKTGTEPSRDRLLRHPWPARSPNGEVNMTSLLDIQSWFFTNKLISAELPAARLVDPTYLRNAVQTLGAFAVANRSSTLAGCR